MEYKRWPKIAAHIGAGMRLRKCLTNFSLDNDVVEGIFLSNGKNIDAKGLGKDSVVQENLRQTIKRIESTRAKSSSINTDDALDAWQGLIEGRWSLVDRFDSDGKRFIVAIKNNLSHLDPRGLSQREREVAEYLGMGKSIKEIAYTLGISLSAVTNCIPRIQQELGITSLTELVQFFSPIGMRAKLMEMKINNESILFSTASRINQHRARHLTQAEQEILEHLISGSTHADIAHRRSTSVNTVSSQIQTIYQKHNLAGLLKDRNTEQIELLSSSPKQTNNQTVLQRQISEIDQQITEVEIQQMAVLTAPMEGRVTTLMAETGQSVNTTSPMLSIFPTGAKLEAQLYVSTSAAGFIKIGQTVAIRYQAFPYQRFGHFLGKIIEVGHTVIQPGEANLPMQLQESVYRVKVQLPSQVVNARGETISLQAGMLLDADIWVDRRRLIDWIFDPLISVTGRA